MTDWMLNQIGQCDPTFFDPPDPKKEALREHVWVTASGQRIPYKDLSDRHLINIIRLLIRRHDAWILGSGAHADGSAEEAIHQCDNNGPAFTVYPNYGVLVGHALGRGLHAEVKASGHVPEWEFFEELEEV